MFFVKLLSYYINFPYVCDSYCTRMKIPSRNLSLASTLRTLLTIALFLQTAFCLFMLVTVFLETDGISYSWPVTLHNENQAAEIQPARETVTEIYLMDSPAGIKTREDKILRITDSSSIARTLSTVHNLAILTAILVVTVLLRSLLKTIAAGAPFESGTPNKITSMAYALIGLTVFGLLESVAGRIYIAQAVHLEGARFDNLYLSNHISLQAFLTGALLLVLAQVWRAAHNLKTENESFV